MWKMPRRNNPGSRSKVKGKPMIKLDDSTLLLLILLATLGLLGIPLALDLWRDRRRAEHGNTDSQRKK
jgi:hypothetical protein